MWICTKSSASRDPKNPTSRTTYQNPSFCALAFFWMEYVWMMSAVPNLQKSRRMGSPMEKRYLFLKPKKRPGNMTIGEAGHTTKLYAILEPIDLQCYINTDSAKKSKNTLWPSHLVQHRNVYPKTSHFKEPEGVPALTSWRAKIALLHPGKSCGRHRLLWSIQISTPCCWTGMCWGSVAALNGWTACHVAEATCWSPDSNVWGFVSTQVTCPFT